VQSVAFNHDGTLLASGGLDGTARIWDPATGECLHTLTGHTGSVQSVAFNHDGTLLASGGVDGTARIWDPATGQTVLVMVGRGKGTAAWIPREERLLSASGDAWRWLRVQVHDDTGRLLSQDPYEWHYPTGGELASMDRTSNHK